MSQTIVFICAAASLALWVTSFATDSTFVAVVAAVTSAFTLGGWTFGAKRVDVERTTPVGAAADRVSAPRPADRTPSSTPELPVRQAPPGYSGPSTDVGVRPKPVGPAQVLPQRLEISQPETVTPNAVVRALLRNCEAAGKPVAAHLWLVDTATATLRLVTANGPQRPSERPHSLDEDELGEVAMSGEAALYPFGKRTSGHTQETLWRYAIPTGRDTDAGVAAVDFAQEGEPNPEVLNHIAAAMRVSISGALALHVARQRERAAKTLMDATRALSRSLDPEDVIAGALETAMNLSDASTGSVMLLDESTEERMTIAAADGLPDAVVHETSVALGEGIAGWVAASGQPLLVEDLPGRPGRSDRHGIRSAVSVPIADEDGLLGVLNVGSRSFPARFTTEHLETLEMLGRQTAVALRNARASRSAGELYLGSLKALALAMETKDPYSQGGTERILELARDLGVSMGLEEKELKSLEVAAMMHDIGMGGLAASTASCSRPLTTVERGLIKMHPSIAKEILEQAPALKEVIPIVYHHHENFDGSGYVDGMSGEMIPLGARILAVADAFVAMTSARPYREAMTFSEARRELEEKAGTQFDPAVIEAFRGLQGAGSDRAPERER